MSPQKNWSLKTVLKQFAIKVTEATGSNPMEAGSPARDESVGTMIGLLVAYEYGLAPELPGQMEIGEDE